MMRPQFIPSYDCRLWIMVSKLLGVWKKKTRRGASDCQNGHENVHKQFPVIPEHRKVSIIVVRNPGDGRLYRACPNQLMFGSVRVVQHYNIISRISATLCVRVFRIPLVAYFDDYAETMKNWICKSALEAVIWITSLGSSQGPQRCDGPTSEIIGANCQFIPTMADYSARRRKNWDPPLSPGQPWTRQDGLGKGGETNWEVEFLPNVCGWTYHALHIPGSCINSYIRVLVTASHLLNSSRYCVLGKFCSLSQWKE